MRMEELISYIIIGASIFFLFLYWIIHRKKTDKPVMKITAYEALKQKNLEAIENGKRVIYLLGDSFISQENAISSVLGLQPLRIFARKNIYNDQSNIIQSGDASLAILSRKILAGSYQDAVAPELFRGSYAQFVAPTPTAYVGGSIPEIRKDINGGLVMIGYLSPEFLLSSQLADDLHIFCLGASSSPAAQAVFWPSTQTSVIGEEYFALSAALESKPIHIASLRTQDTLRILVIIFILIGIALRLSGILK